LPRRRNLRDRVFSGRTPDMLGKLFKQMRTTGPVAAERTDRQYSLAEALDDLPMINILDVGAMMLEAESPYGGLIEAGLARLTGFEPNEAECQKLNQCFGAPHEFYPHFIGDGSPAVFYETNFAMTGSLYKPNKPLLEKFHALEEVTQLVKEHPVQTRRLDDIAGIGDVDFFKIDVQGGELNVFKGAPRTLASTLVVQTEVEFVSLYENQPMFADVDIFLRSQGFQFHTILTVGKRYFKPIFNGAEPERGVHQQLWADAVYVRDWMALEALSLEQLKKYALLLDALYQSKDLCCLVLTQIDARTGSNHAAGYVQAWNRGPAPQQ
jgi:FkbM family methyltransferase